MRQTLFFIPDQFLGLPVFGWGLALAIWCVAAVALLSVMWRRRGWDEELRGVLPILVAIAAALVFVLPRLEARAPDGTVLGLPIRGYGVMMLTGVLAGLGLTVRLARRVGIDGDTVYSLAFWMFVAGIAGARALYVALNWADFRRDTWLATGVEIAKFTEGGLVVFGALIGALCAFFVFTRVRGLPRLLLADVVAPGMALGLALGRIGCLFNGCCFGGETQCPWAIEFPRYTCAAQRILSPPYGHQLALGRLHGIRVGGGAAGAEVVAVEPGSAAARAGVRPGMRIAAINGWPAGELAAAKRRLVECGPAIALRTTQGRTIRWSLGTLPTHSLPVHPAQIYSAVDGAVLCFFLWCFFPCRPFDGAVFASEMTLHPLSRFLLEIIRDDEPGRWGTSLTISQIISLAALGLVAGLWLYLLRRPRVAARGEEARVRA